MWTGVENKIKKVKNKNKKEVYELHYNRPQRPYGNLSGTSISIY